MWKLRFSEEQVVGILREADRDPVPHGGQAARCQQADDYTLRQRFSGMSADDVKKLRHLEQENARLKKLLA